MDATGPTALDGALCAAITCYRTQVRHELERQTEAFEQRFLLARLGLSPAELDTVAAAASPTTLPPELARRIESRLVAEAERLLRLARAGSARYDLNRHIAVHRALGWVCSRPARQGKTPAEDRQPGRVANARFRRSRTPRRRQPGSPASGCADLSHTPSGPRPGPTGPSHPFG